MDHYFILAVFGIAFFSTASAKEFPTENCNLKSPPASARIKAGRHGLDLHIFPGKLPVAYSGCQLVWLPDGFKLATLMYVSGRLIMLKGQGPGEETTVCHFDANGLLAIAKSSGSGCRPTANELIKGLAN